MVGARRAPTQLLGAAFAPGHVTGVFSPDLRSRDPRGRGSIGAGLVLELGARAAVRWSPNVRRRLLLRSNVGGPLPISNDVVRHLWSDRGGRLEVWLQHDLPIGQGFSMSAAGALATAMALGRMFGISQTRAIEVAHLADLFGRGGLGGVASILGGGLEIRQRAGVPPWGRVRHLAARGRLVIGVTGRPIASPDLLSSPAFLRRVQRSAPPRLGRLERTPSLPAFFEEAWGFARDLDIASPPLRRFLQWANSAGIAATQAMFGNSFIALPQTRSQRTTIFDRLERAGWHAAEVGLAARGARIVPPARESLLERGFLGARP